MPYASLDIGEHLASIGLIPPTPSVQVLSRDTKLDDEIARQVVGLDLATFLLPEPKEGSLIIAHDDPGVRTTDKIAAIGRSAPSVQRARSARAFTVP
jgi:hypothetical protein